MARPIPFARTSQAARARRNRALLLPMPRAEADRLALQAHVALDAMRLGHGSATAAQTLCQVMILTGLLAEAGYAEATFEQMREAEGVICAAFDRGRESGTWLLEKEGFQQFAVIVTTYDAQLRRAPLAVIADASDRLERFRGGDSFEHRKRA
ncbi:hypothetical protein H3V53_34860 [Paraburkholderia bengalensis]|uniref:Fis family transcriptional regulator n=1 Tax=Paraburkholderia bengalensis TaxID=2747562 RepID=A0ABU8J379_9BURK